MPPSSLVKFSNRAASGGKKLFWDRVTAGADSLPYRGQFAPMYREDEFEERTVRVADARNAFFDVSEPASNKLYLDVMECCYNGWFQLVHLERFWVNEAGRRTTCHYVEWVEYYVEDGSRTPFVTPGVTELAHGQQDFAGHLG
jgi:hypothetical protein